VQLGYPRTGEQNRAPDGCCHRLSPSLPVSPRHRRRLLATPTACSPRFLRSAAVAAAAATARGDSQSAASGGHSAGKGEEFRGGGCRAA